MKQQLLKGSISCPEHGEHDVSISLEGNTFEIAITGPKVSTKFYEHKRYITNPLASANILIERVDEQWGEIIRGMNT